LQQVWSEQQPVILVDAGDMMGRQNQEQREQSHFLAEMTSSFGYDAIGLGEMDLNYGLDYLRDLIKEYGLPFVSANVRDSISGEPILPTHLIVERGGLRFAITSVLDPELPIKTMSAQDPQLIVDDPVATLRDLVPQLREQADTVILLSHTGDKKAQDLLKEIDGIDVTVVGHAYRTFQNERVVSGSLFLSAVYEGRNIGRADLQLDQDGQVQAFTVNVKELGSDIEEDPDMLAKVEAFKKHLDEFRQSLRGAHKQTKGAATESYLGEHTCAKCHDDVWQVVSQSPHRKALLSLQTKGQSDNPECLVCHVVGYEFINGYDTQPPHNRLGNVQCEACHGYGTMHSRDGRMLTMARESCTTCHDEKNSPNFDYTSYWHKIAH
jgi:hypothetical protein